MRSPLRFVRRIHAIVQAMIWQFELQRRALRGDGLDGLDGRVARLTRTQSEFGAEFDSLSDMVSSASHRRW